MNDQKFLVQTLIKCYTMVRNANKLQSENSKLLIYMFETLDFLSRQNKSERRAKIAYGKNESIIKILDLGPSHSLHRLKTGLGLIKYLLV